MIGLHAGGHDTGCEGWQEGSWVGYEMARGESELARRRCEELSDFEGFRAFCAVGTRFLRVWNV